MANAIARCCFTCATGPGSVPHAYFSWSESSPLGQVLRYLLLGTRDIEKRAELADALFMQTPRGAA